MSACEEGERSIGWHPAAAQTPSLRASDLDIIHAELRAKDIEQCGKQIESFKKLRTVRGSCCRRPLPTGGEGEAEATRCSGPLGCRSATLAGAVKRRTCRHLQRQSSIPPPPPSPAHTRAQTLTKEQKDELASAEKVLAWLQEGKDIRFGEWSLKDVDWLNSVQVTAWAPETGTAARARGGGSSCIALGMFGTAVQRLVAPHPLGGCAASVAHGRPMCTPPPRSF